MPKKQQHNTTIILLLLLLTVAILSWYLLKISSVFIIAVLLLVGLKVGNIYENKKIQLFKICIIGVILSLWFALLFGLYFSNTVMDSIVGNALATFIKNTFGTLGLFLFGLLSGGFVMWLISKWRKPKEKEYISIPNSIQKRIESEKTIIEIPQDEPEIDITAPDISIISPNYQFPSLELLNNYPQEIPENIDEEIENKKQVIKQTLVDFGINTTDIIATTGVNVTLYELVLARGVSANRIKTIDEDIARALRVQAVRIISPFKNRGTVALEVPNNKSQIVGLKNILETPEFQNCTYELPLALGKTIDNKPQIIDLAEMPHILVAGATGQGKSVCLNAMILSLLYAKSPAKLKLVLIDPKLAEFSIYEEIRKQFRPAIHEIKNIVINDDADEIAITLQVLCNEMHKRLLLFKNTKCRNIKEYNAEKQIKNLAYLPYIVVVIDEFADMITNKTIKESIILLARQARAAGIHLVAATQRPSATAVGGDITANFPARIAFKVIKWQNSDIILGDSGAEKLIGKGDMLFSYNSEIERLQGAFVSTDEVERVAEFIEKQR